MSGANPTTALCPYCGLALSKGILVVICPADGTVHHADCWEANNRSCARYGCTGAGQIAAIRYAPASSLPHARSAGHKLPPQLAQTLRRGALILISSLAGIALIGGMLLLLAQVLDAWWQPAISIASWVGPLGILAVVVGGIALAYRYPDALFERFFLALLAYIWATQLLLDASFVRELEGGSLPVGLLLCLVVVAAAAASVIVGRALARSALYVSLGWYMISVFAQVYEQNLAAFSSLLWLSAFVLLFIPLPLAPALRAVAATIVGWWSLRSNCCGIMPNPATLVVLCAFPLAGWLNQRLSREKNLEEQATAASYLCNIGDGAVAGVLLAMLLMLFNFAGEALNPWTQQAFNQLIVLLEQLTYSFPWLDINIRPHALAATSLGVLSIFSTLLGLALLDAQGLVRLAYSLARLLLMLVVGLGIGALVYGQLSNLVGSQLYRDWTQQWVLTWGLLTVAIGGIYMLRHANVGLPFFLVIALCGIWYIEYYIVTALAFLLIRPLLDSFAAGGSWPAQTLMLCLLITIALCFGIAALGGWIGIDARLRLRLAAVFTQAQRIFDRALAFQLGA